MAFVSGLTGSLASSVLPRRTYSTCSAAKQPVRRLNLSVSAVAGFQRTQPTVAEPVQPASTLTGTAQMLERSFEASAGTVEVAGAPSATLPAPRAGQTAGKREIILVLEGETLHSTFKQKVVVGGGLTIMGALFTVGAVQVHDTPSAAAAVAAIGSAYLFADFASGIYHWAVDNYGSADTPFVGNQIAGFQAHHQRPWTITEREFANNVHKVFIPALPFAVASLAASPWLPGWACLWLATATTSEVLSQQFHAWAHMKKSELPPAVIALQDWGLLISRRSHGAHHRAPFEGNYCIVSGFWNPLLDQDGRDDGFFRQLENFVHSTTGAEPRCWHAPLYEWKEDKDKPVAE